MSGDALTREEVDALLEAARWAPSCFNAQPWRFAWALSGTPQWQTLFDVLVEANQSWVKNAGALFAVVLANIVSLFLIRIVGKSLD